jgi:hypothetical protein
MVNLTSNMTYFFDSQGSLIWHRPYASYSLRKLPSASYTGPVYQVKRGYDAALADVYSDTLGVITSITTLSDSSSTTDTSIISCWFNSPGNVSVTKLYDQSGNSRHMVPCSAAALPQVLVTDIQNSPPQMIFSNSPMKYAFSGSFPTARTVVAMFDITQSGDFAYSSIGDGTLNYEMIGRRFTATSKLNLQGTSDTYSVINDAFGEAVGPTSYSYSYSNKSVWNTFTAQGQLKS